MEPVEIVKGKYLIAKIYTDLDAPDPRVEFDYFTCSEVIAWTNGEVYGYVIETPEGEHVDSCWGYYGFSWAMQEVEEQLDHHERFGPMVREFAATNLVRYLDGEIGPEEYIATTDAFHE